MSGSIRRPPSNVHEDIPEELLANIPLVASNESDVPHAFVPDEDEVLAMPAGSPDPATEAAPRQTSPIAAQLRYEMGEAFARELDRAEASLTATLTELEARLVAAEGALAEALSSMERERASRRDAEARLKAFKELALK